MEDLSPPGTDERPCGLRDDHAVGATAALTGQTKGEPEAPQRWQRMDRSGLIETARAWADRQMVEHDTRTDLAQSLRDAAFYRADALYEFAAHIEDGNFDAVRTSAPSSVDDAIRRAENQTLTAKMEELRLIRQMAAESVKWDEENLAAIPAERADEPSFSVGRYWRDRAAISRSWQAFCADPTNHPGRANLTHDGAERVHEQVSQPIRDEQ